MTACERCKEVFQLNSDRAADASLDGSYVILLDDPLSPHETLIERSDPAIPEIDHQSRRKMQSNSASFSDLGSMLQSIEKFEEDSGAFFSQSVNNESTKPAYFRYADINRHVRFRSRLHDHCLGLPVTLPVCANCVHIMSQELEANVERTREEKRHFVMYLQALSHQFSIKEREMAHKSTEMSLIYEVEAQTLRENLSLMLDEIERLEMQNHDMTASIQTLDDEERSLWIYLNHIKFRQNTFNELRDSAVSRFALAERRAASIESQHCLSQAFVISHRGAFGTINAFRLGKHPSTHVEWHEINSGLGEASLLMQTLAGILNISFTEYSLVVVASFSKIVCRSNTRMQFRLYGSDEDNFPESSFNLGLRGWVACLGEVLAYVRTQDPTLAFPYEIASQTINGYSILYSEATLEIWTRALRYALTDLKWLLTWDRYDKLMTHNRGLSPFGLGRNTQ